MKTKPRDNYSKRMDGRFVTEWLKTTSARRLGLP